MIYEKKLVSDIIEGDENALCEFIDRYKNLISHIVWKMVRIEADREDLCQEIIIKVYKNLSRFEFKSKLSSWIGKISYNHCCNYLKKQIIVFEYDNLYEKNPEVIESSIQFKNRSSNSIFFPEKNVNSLEISEIVQNEVEKLPEIHQMILTLYHIDGMSYDEISDITDLPMGTVKSYLFRARKTLKEKLLKKYSREELCL